MHVSTAVCKELGFETEEANAMLVLEAAYCEQDAANAQYAKLAKSAKQQAKDSKDKEETLAPESKKEAKELKEQVDISAPDIIDNTPHVAN